jgi:nucleotide-binding universal stress UspA family protein
MNPTVILCPVEFSMSGTAAFAQAVQLARQYDAELHVAHVIGGRERRRQATELPGTGDVDQRFSSFKEAVNTDGLRLHTVALAGDPVTVVTEYANLISADLLVVARHGRRYGIYWRPGVYAKDLARAVSCSTLSVPDGVPLRAKGSFVEILCPMDLSAASAEALRQALIFAHQSEGRLTLLHVLPGLPYETAGVGAGASDAAARLIGDDRAMVDRISRELRNAAPLGAFNSCHLDTKVVSGAAHRSILTTESELGADLIVMGLSERSGVDRVIMASTEALVLQGAGCPVLMVSATASRDASRVVAGETAHNGAAVEVATAPMSAESLTARAVSA